MTATASSLFADTGPGVGQNAPGFQLTNMDKVPVTLTSLRQKGPVLLIFWSTRCPVCHAMLPQFKQAHSKYKSKKLSIVAIDVGFENHDEVADYILQHNIKYLVLNQDNRKAQIARAYRLIGTPTIKLIDPTGKILFSGYQLPDIKKYLN